MAQLWSASSRSLLVSSFVGLFAACAPPAPGDALLRELETKQFLKYAGPNADKVRAEIKDKGWPALFGESGRVFGADGLGLAKGGVGKFIETLRPFLEGQGVKVPEIKDDLQQSSYTLMVDGAPLPIWTSV